MIGSSDGNTYNDSLDAHLGNAIPQGDSAVKTPRKATEKPAGEFNSQPGTKHVDNTKDVPLAASALHKDGQFYGIAVDKDAPITDLGIKGWSPWLGVYEHERAEFEHMKNLIATGMPAQDAYHEAHDKIATPTETAYVRGIASQNGKDPDKFLDEYKQYWRDVTKVSGEGPFDRHPDAHTTTFGLDESELPPEAKHHLKEVLQEQRDTAQGLVKHLTEPFAEIGRAMTGQATSEDIPGLASNLLPAGKFGTIGKALFGGAMAKGFSHEAYEQAYQMAKKGAPEELIWNATGIHFGAEGKPRFEINDYNSKLTLDKAKEALKYSSSTKLGDILDHPELYKHYPEFKNIEVSYDPDISTNGAYYDDKLKLIGLSQRHDTEQMLKETILHEVQHAIQYKEGFTHGASRASMIPYINKAIERQGLKPTDFENPVDQYQRAITKAYQAIGGEVEARNVEFRADMTPEESKLIPPSHTEDTPRESQLHHPTEETMPNASEGKTDYEKRIEDFQRKNNLPLNTREQTIDAIKLRIGQIERDRRGSKIAGEDYPPSGELYSLRQRLKELQSSSRNESAPWTGKEVAMAKRGELPEGRTAAALAQVRTRLGITDKQGPRWTPEDLKVIKDTSGYLSDREIGEMLKRTPESIKQARKKLLK